MENEVEEEEEEETISRRKSSTISLIHQFYNYPWTSEYQKALQK